MKNYTWIKECLKLIEDKLDWGPSEEWTHFDFEKLSALILEKTDYAISTQTLKRLFGKVSHHKNYKPQAATKNALAAFLNYPNWAQFIKQLETNTFENSKDKDFGPTETYKQKRLFTKRKAVIYAGVFFISIVFTLVFSWKYISSFVINTTTDPKISITPGQLSGTVPHTVVFKYKIPTNTHDDVFLDFDYIHPVKGYQSILLNPGDSILRHSYIIPGVYRIGVISKNTVLNTYTAQIKSKDWLCIFYDNKESQQIELVGGEIKYRQLLGISNIIHRVPENGIYHVSREELKAMKFNTQSEYFLIYRKIDDFNISGDNFMFSSRFKNNEQTGGISCYDVMVTLYGELDRFVILLVENGCTRYATVVASESKVSGDSYDLSRFNFETGKWCNLRIENKNKAYRVYVNNEQIFNGAYFEPIGQIIGIDIQFKGSGLIDEVLLNDLITKNEFFEGFD